MVPCGDIPPVGVEQSREEHSLLNRDRIEQCPAPHIVFEAACLLFEERRQVTRPYRVCVPNDKDRRPIGLTRHRLFLLFVAAWLEAVHAKPPLASDNGALGRLEWVDHQHHRDRNNDGDERSHKDVRILDDRDDQRRENMSGQED